MFLDAPYAIAFTYVDHKDNAFVDLMAYGFATQADRDLHWDVLKEDASGKSDDGEFLADLYGPDGMSANKTVAPEQIEAITAKPIEMLLLRGRRQNKDLQELLTRRLAAKRKVHGLPSINAG